MIDAFGFALTGLREGLRYQPHVRMHFMAAVAVCMVGGAVPLSVGAKAALLLASGAVIAAELMNTAVESAVDLASPHLDPLAKRAKDAAAGAVLVLAAASAFVLVTVLVGEWGRVRMDDALRTSAYGWPLVAATWAAMHPRGALRTAGRVTIVGCLACAWVFTRDPIFTSFATLLEALVLSAGPARPRGRSTRGTAPRPR